MRPEWRDFSGGVWEREINVRDFIQKNYTPYDGDDTFLAGPTQATMDLWAQVMDLTAKEREAGGVLDMDTKIVSTITSHGPGYLDKEKEQIVGFQTDKPFKRSLQPYGGIRMAENTYVMTCRYSRITYQAAKNAEAAARRGSGGFSSLGGGGGFSGGGSGGGTR